MSDRNSQLGAAAWEGANPLGPASLDETSLAAETPVGSERANLSPARLIVEVRGSTDSPEREQRTALCIHPEFIATLDAAGYVIVPKEPTKAMLRAAKGALYRYFAGMTQAERDAFKAKPGGIRLGWHKKYLIRWQAMLAAGVKHGDEG